MFLLTAVHHVYLSHHNHVGSLFALNSTVTNELYPKSYWTKSALAARNIFHMCPTRKVPLLQVYNLFYCYISHIIKPWLK